MADERDTDRLAGELLGLLRGSLTKPTYGAGQTASRPQVDEGSMLNTIKDFLNQTLPGTREKEKPPASTAPLGGPTGYQYSGPVAAAVEVDWLGMYRRQEREREAMHQRQTRERESVLERQRSEMEAFAGIRRPVSEEPVRPSVGPAVAPKPSGPEAGIVPGQSIGRWSVLTENGPKTFLAISPEQAFREARRHGLTPSAARLTGIHTYTPEELQKLLSSFNVSGKRESRAAEFEQAIKLGLIPPNAQLELIGDRDWGFRVGDSPVVHTSSDLTPRRTW